MAYPKELWENTRITHKTYPFQLFRNRCDDAAPGQNVLFPHWHEHFEIIIVRQGEMLVHIDSRAYEASEGDILFVPGGGLHAGYAIRQESIRYDCIVFNGSLFSDWAHDPVHTALVTPYLDGSLQFPVRALDGDHAPAAEHGLIEDVVRELANKEQGYELVVKSKLHLLFALLSRRFLPERHERDRRTRPGFHHHESFKSLLRRIDGNPNEKLTIAQAAAAVNLNPYHFCKLFKKLTGRTFIDYVNVSRMNEAERLLLETDASIAEISERCGCGNPNYFTKLYKQYKGVSPSQARKM